MRFVIGIHSLAGTGGTESYVTTVGDHLQRSGHDVWVYAAEDGRTGDAARALGLRVTTDRRALPEEIDVALVNDSVVALELLDARSSAPQIYVWHSDIFDVQVPPQLDGVTSRIVTLYAEGRRKAESLAVSAPIVELSHPVDCYRFQPQTPLGREPRALTLGNYLGGERKQILERACKRAGIELTSVGAQSENGVTDRPEDAFNRADIVFAKSKAAVEAMACGRAVFVFDAFGSDGWVTADSYERLAAGCFAGNKGGQTVEVEALVRALGEYDPAMGVVNRDLAVVNHSAIAHAAAIASLAEEVAAENGRRGEAQRHDVLFELARLARVNWRHESQAFAAGLALQQSELARGDLAWGLEKATAERDAAKTAAEEADRKLAEIVNSSRWRLLSRLLAPLDKLRRRR